MSPTTPAAARPSVLFVCAHNAGRSQMAAAYLTHLSGGLIDVSSAGAAPADALNPHAVAVMLQDAIDIREESPKMLTVEAVQDADLVIALGAGDLRSFAPDRFYDEWDVPDPAGLSLEAVRRILDDIRERVIGLLDQLTVAAVA
ncbi:MAG: phosphotyrosine protein phosphatase [Micropruina sp.]|nr:phosphotyrosine protein phosphatase [Micropruina sp.]